MSDELETLNDLKFEVSAVDKYATTWNAVDSEVLKLSAIDDIRTIRQSGCHEFRHEMNLNEITRVHNIAVREGKILYIKQKFNITEKDLE